MFNVQRRAAIFRGEYTSPLFQAFNEAWQLQEALYQVLAPYGVGAADVRMERRVAEPSFTCNVLSLGMVVNVGLSWFEVFLMQPQDSDKTRSGLIRLLLERLSGFTQGFRVFSLALDHHGTLEGSTAKEFIARYVRAPEGGLGELSNMSAAFYYGPSGTRAATSIHLEPSSFVSGGLFVKTHCVWQAEGLTIDALVDDAGAAVRQTMELLGLTQPSPIVPSGTV